MSEEYATKWVKDMKQMKVVKRRGQNEHLKQGVGVTESVFMVFIYLWSLTI